MGWIGVRADDDEIVVHHIVAVDAVALRYELVLPSPIMNKQRIGIASRTDCKRVAGSDCDDVNVYASRGVKNWQDAIK